VPGHVWVRRTRDNDQAHLYFSIEQLKTLRANVAAAIVKANKHRMEDEKQS